MRLAIVGSREYPDWKQVIDYVNTLPEGTTIVSGGARGVDRIAEQAARQRGLSVVVYKPDWNQYGKGAGLIRNYDIVSNSDKVVAFWDGASKGTKHSIDTAKKLGKPLEIFYPTTGSLL